MPTADTDVLSAAYRTLKEACGLVDRSERGKLALTGSGAVEFLNGQVTNELADLHPGEGRYAAFLTHKGKMLGDLRILAVAGEDAGAPIELLLDTERVALQALFDMIRRFKVGYEVELHKRTLERGLLSLIGPEAAMVAGGDGSEIQRLAEIEHSSAPVDIDRAAALAVRTDVGIDLICDAAETEALTAALLARGAAQVAPQAAEYLRVELGRPRFGIDLDETTIPQEAGLNERAVSFTKGCYVGQETVARLHYRGKPNRHLRGLRLSAPAATGDELALADRPVGRIGSAVISPALGPIALALVRREAEPGAIVSVGEHGASAEIVELPFAAAGQEQAPGPAEPG
ncbi:MAG: YgfZ/GcvT domain-containing protein [Solirubrobacterales bacterium]